ncbi:MAG: HNH endonuclease domain-containing protein [Floccifex sp.]
MSDYIKLWITIIENMNNDNTYKLAWGRAILECIVEKKHGTVITFQEIAYKMLKYYWNQIDFFQLKQSPGKKPVIVQETEKCIDFVQGKRKSTIPIWFDKAEYFLKEDKAFYQKEIQKIATTLTHDVSWRFQYVNKEMLNVYELNIKEKTVTFTKEQIMDLKEYAFVLSQLLNYRWAQLLEKFNHCPKIASKVKGISDAKIRRNNLTKFKEILLMQMEKGKIIDFYTGDILKENEISLDHVIPWSFMYSDDIWNLVITSRSNNSSKSNSIPSQNIINKLEQRNVDLLHQLPESNKYYNELKLAIDNNYVEKFYMSMKM